MKDYYFLIENVEFKLYDIDFLVMTKIEEERVDIIIQSRVLQKDMRFICLEDYSQQFRRMLEGFWRAKRNGCPCEEYRAALLLLHGQFEYYSVLLYENYRKNGKNEQDFRKNCPASHRAISHILRKIR